MKTLIINCYRNRQDEKIKDYFGLISNLSSYEYDVKYHRDIEKNHNVENYNFIIISGSENCISKKQYSPDFLEFLKRVNIPVLGICYGHQIIAKAFSVEIIHGSEAINKPYPERPEEVQILDKNEIFIGLKNKINVYESHQEYVNPEYLDKFGIKLLASSKSCPVEAFKHLKRPLYGVQFHIERSGEVGKKIISNFYKLVV